MKIFLRLLMGFALLMALASCDTQELSAPTQESRKNMMTIGIRFSSVDYRVNSPGKG